MLKLFLFILLILISEAKATNYHTSNSGNDANSCSAAQSASTPKLTIDAGIRCLPSGGGHTLYIRGGTYNEYIDSNSFAGNSFPIGTSFSNAITIASYPGETAVINGNINLPHPYLQYIIFDRITIDGTGSQNSVISGGSNGAHHVRFQDGIIRNAAQGTAQQACGNNSANIITGGHHWEFIRNKIYNSRWSYGLYWTSNNGIIDGNEIYNNDGYGIQLYNGSTCDADNNIIRNNKIYNNAFNNTCGATFAIVINCAHNNQLYNNLIYGNNDGIHETNNATGNVYYHNTIYNNINGPGLSIQFPTSGAAAINNIIYLNQSAISGTPGTQNNNTTTNPSFVNAGAGDFHLQAEIAGADLTATVPTDHGGSLRTVPVTRGAWEFAAGTTPDWTFCAFENATCSFVGTKEVRYGSPDLNIWIADRFTNGVACNNATWSDPAPAQGKECYYRDLTLVGMGGFFE